MNADTVSSQLSTGIKASSFKVDVETCKYFKKPDETVMNSFDKAGITEAINFAKDDYSRLENPFDKKRTKGKII